MKKKIFLFWMFIGYFFLISISCQRNKSKLSKKEYKIIENCIEYIKTNNEYNIKDDYVLNPYYSHFTLSNFFEFRSKKFTQFFKGRDKKELLNTQKRINKIYAGEFNKKLFEFSKNKSSKYVISFSGFGKNLIMGYINYNSTPVFKSDKKEDYLTDGSNIDYFIFEFDEKGNIINVIKTAITVG